MCAVVGLYPVTDIVVCGHSHCGVMEAHPAFEVVEPSFAAQWLDHAARTLVFVRERYWHLEGEPLRDALAGENVLVQLSNDFDPDKSGVVLEVGRFFEGKNQGVATGDEADEEKHFGKRRPRRGGIRPALAGLFLG